MTNVAILVGNSEYRHLGELNCCIDDVYAMKELLEATEKYAKVEVIINTSADELKSRMRASINESSSVEELLFYFTGHGHQQEDDFYYCSTGFDLKRPNETGLSTSELYTILRLSGADLVVKIVDACNSGTLLVKSGNSFVQQKHGFKSLIQISSCLDTENSLTGDPLSPFTQSFRTAALRKLEGEVFFTDIIYTLRDEFRLNDFQTPYFVAQGTGREQFVDNAKRLDGLRAKLSALAAPAPLLETESQQPFPAVPTLRDLLQNAEQKIASPEQVSHFVSVLFDNINSKLSSGEFAEFFDLDILEHSDFKESTTRAFIIRVLDKESRPDNFVVAKITKKYRGNPLALASVSLAQMMNGEEAFAETYDLDLNCTMHRVQLRVTLTPRFHSLRRIVLVVTCAPSLQNCYIFEIATEHRLKDFGTFDADGREMVRRWYKREWGKSPLEVVEKVVSKLEELIREHLEATAKKLRDDKS